MLGGFTYDDDGRGKYPVALSTRVPLDLRENLQHVAAAERVSINEFIRRAIGERIARLTGGKDRDGYSGPHALAAA
jgi:Ribbon-helix-helix protein, copG family